jgi:hypothetical protein
VLAEAQDDVDIVVLFLVGAGEVCENGSEQRKTLLVGENSDIDQLGVKAKIDTQLANVLNL